jgi:hypothetical protein
VRTCLDTSAPSVRRSNAAANPDTLLKVSEISTGERAELLRRVLASRQFAHADNLKRILRYLAERQAENSGSPKEYEIAVAALGRPAHFDPRTDPIVRVSVSAIRDRLFAYFASEGAHTEWRAEIPKGQYQLQFLPNAASVQHQELAERPVARFWQPYLEGHKANYVVYTEPLFFRDGQGGFLRSWYVNDVRDGAARIADRYPMLETTNLEPAFHYLSSGEMHCLLSLTRVFHEAGVPVETRNSRNSHWTELSQANLILLGSPRTNSFLRQLQGDVPFLTEDHQILIHDGKDGTERLEGRRYLDGQLQRLTEYAVVTRRPGLVEGTVITMIAANHGRAIEGSAHWLTLDNQVEKILLALGCAEQGPLPSSFQMLFRVEALDLDDQVSGVFLERAVVYR